MKKIIYLALFVLATSASCRQTKDLKSYYVKLCPIGNSDVFHDTLIISMNPQLFPPKKITYIRLLTDSTTLNKVVDFVKQYKPSEKFDEKTFGKIGCFEILLYKGKLLIDSYYLNNPKSRKYLSKLISTLSESNLDPKLIKIIKEDLLRPIEFN
jgi:hypothetical protein